MIHTGFLTKKNNVDEQQGSYLVWPLINSQGKFPEFNSLSIQREDTYVILKGAGFFGY